MAAGTISACGPGASAKVQIQVADGQVYSVYEVSFPFPHLPPEYRFMQLLVNVSPVTDGYHHQWVSHPKLHKTLAWYILKCYQSYMV